MLCCVCDAKVKKEKQKIKKIQHTRALKHMKHSQQNKRLSKNKKRPFSSKSNNSKPKFVISQKISHFCFVFLTLSFTHSLIHSISLSLLRGYRDTKYTTDGFSR
jgi:hypothetical protein